MRLNHMNKNIRITLSILSVIFLLVSAVLIRLGSIDPRFTQKWITYGIYPYLSGVLTLISNLFPFSIGGVILLIIGTVFLYLISSIVFNGLGRRYEKCKTDLVIIAFLLSWNFFLFQLAFGLNNYRESMEELFQLEPMDITVEDLSETYAYLVTQTNLAKQAMQNNNTDENMEYVYKNTYKGYPVLSEKFSFISPKKVIAKPLWISSLFSSSGYTGIYLYYIGEPNINIEAPYFSLGFVAAHEIAHQKGFSSENDANFIGFLACINHPDAYFRYSGYEAMLVYVGNSLYEADKKSYQRLSQELSPAVKQDLETERQFWTEHVVKKNEEVHNSINNSFLKANNQPEGIISYSRVTELIVESFKQGLF